MKKGDSKEKKPIYLLQSHYYDGLIEAGCDEAGRGVWLEVCMLQR